MPNRIELPENIVQTAKKLPFMAQIFAVEMSVPLITAHPELKHISPQKWDLYVYVACISVGIIALYKYPDLSVEQKHSIYDLILSTAQETRNETSAVYIEWIKFAEIQTDRVVQNIVGRWVTSNLCSGPVSSKTSHSIGSLICRDFGDIWLEK